MIKIIKKEFVFINIIKFLKIYDFINLSKCNRKLYSYFFKNYIWKEKNKNIININQNIINYKSQFIMNFNCKNRSLCSICNQYIIKDFYISMHNCNYGFIRCVKCNDLNCICDTYSSYHSKCVSKVNNYIIVCPLCNQHINAYLINYNV